MSGFCHSVRFYTAQNPERPQISNNPSLLLITNLPHFRLIFIYLLTCCIHKLIWKSVVSSPKNNLYPLLTVQLLNSDVHQANVTMTNAWQDPGWLALMYRVITAKERMNRFCKKKKINTPRVAAAPVRQVMLCTTKSFCLACSIPVLLYSSCVIFISVHITFFARQLC